MDINANLSELLSLKASILAAIDADEAVDEADVDRLCELVGALDGWMSSGGFPPERWARRR